MARDDDIDYTIIGLSYFERFGPGFATDDVAGAWLRGLPYHLVYTAERAAYRNLVDGLRPPRSATFRNPYREWIGAQIRADAFGYVSPGWPEKAAEFAYRDAAVSHIKNGTYGEMWVAAMLGARRLPRRWVEPLSDRVTSFVAGYNDNRISELAQRTVKVARQVCGA